MHFINHCIICHNEGIIVPPQKLHLSPCSYIYIYIYLRKPIPINDTCKTTHDLRGFLIIYV